MPAATLLNKDWIGDGTEMSTAVMGKANAHLEKGGDIRIGSMIAGITRYARVSKGKDGHERTMPDGVSLSVSVANAVTSGGRLLNPLIHLAQRRGAVYASRTGCVREIARLCFLCS